MQNSDNYISDDGMISVCGGIKVPGLINPPNELAEAYLRAKRLNPNVNTCTETDTTYIFNTPENDDPVGITRCSRVALPSGSRIYDEYELQDILIDYLQITDTEKALYEKSLREESASDKKSEDSPEGCDRWDTVSGTVKVVSELTPTQKKTLDYLNNEVLLEWVLNYRAQF